MTKPDHLSRTVAGSSGLMDTRLEEVNEGDDMLAAGKGGWCGAR